MNTLFSQAREIGQRSLDNIRPGEQAYAQPREMPAKHGAQASNGKSRSAGAARGPEHAPTDVERYTKPGRWDKPFGRLPIPPQLIQRILSLPTFKDIDTAKFPDDIALADIIANDGRIVRHTRGEIVCHKGDYGNSLYIVLLGSVRCLLTPEGEQAAHGYRPPVQGRHTKHNGARSLSNLLEWLPHSLLNLCIAQAAAIRRRLNKRLHGEPKLTSIENIDELAINFPTYSLTSDQIFGEFEALARTRRNNTIFADSQDTVLLEIRWPGVRDIRSWSDSFREHIEGLYRRHGQETGLRNCALFSGIDEKTLSTINKQCRFETHGEFGWAHHYQRDMSLREDANDIIDHEPVIARQGDYLDDLLIIRTGFARLTEQCGEGERTIGLLKAGDIFGLDELSASLDGGGGRILQRSLRVMGRIDVICVPTHIIEKHVSAATRSKLVAAIPNELALRPAAPMGDNAGLTQAMLDFTVDNRFVNGTQAMAINTDRCVNCDDCVRACATTHNNIPRFVRQGATHHNLMIANACMHCTDPVCLIDCPTNAIHRDLISGSVIIDETTCIGCAACATACPYDNIRMEEIKDAKGDILFDEEGATILTATKCDLCTGQRGGPACQQACPHDALIRIDLGEPDQLAAWLNTAS